MIKEKLTRNKPGAGRVRSKRVCIRMTAEELKALEVAAHHLGASKTDFIAALTMEYVERQGLEVPQSEG